MCYSKQIIPSLGTWVFSGWVYLVHSLHHHKNPYWIPFSKAAGGLWFTKNSLPIQSPLPDVWSLSFQPLATLKMHLSSKSGGLNKSPLIKRGLKEPLIRTQDRQKNLGVKTGCSSFLPGRQKCCLFEGKLLRENSVLNCITEAWNFIN